MLPSSYSLFKVFFVTRPTYKVIVSLKFLGLFKSISATDEYPINLSGNMMHFASLVPRSSIAALRIGMVGSSRCSSKLKWVNNGIAELRNSIAGSSKGLVNFS